MEFNEETAKELAHQHGLSETTIRVWRSRGAIPDKYLTGIKTVITSSHDRQQVENLLRAINTGKFNVSALCQLADVKIHIVHDWMYNSGPLKKEDLIALKKAINTLRIEIKQVLSALEKRSNSEVGAKLTKKLFERKEITWTAFLDYQKNGDMYKRFDSWKRGRRPWPVEDVQQFKGCMLVFLAETGL